jgi:hypothetical protein
VLNWKWTNGVDARSVFLRGELDGSGDGRADCPHRDRSPTAPPNRLWARV